MLFLNSELSVVLYCFIYSLPHSFIVHDNWKRGAVSKRLHSDIASCVYTMLKSASVCVRLFVCVFVAMCAHSVLPPCGVSCLATLWSDMVTGPVHKQSQLNTEHIHRLCGGVLSWRPIL